MSSVFIGPTDIIIDCMFPQLRQADRHCMDRKWHLHMMGVNPNYLADVAARQADKLAHGIGPEGMCPR